MEPKRSGQTGELLVYTIPGEDLDSFLAEWRQLVVPQRAEFGLIVTGAWANRDTSTFVRLVTLEDGAVWEDSLAAFQSSPHRKEAPSDPSRFVQSKVAYPLTETLVAQNPSGQNSELRIYTVPSADQDSYVADWRQSVVPYRAEFGFTVAGAWANRDTNTFAWLVTLEDGAVWEDRLRAYQDFRQRRTRESHPSRFVQSKVVYPLTETVSVS